MANTSHELTARRVLNACLAGEPWQREDVDSLVDGDADELLTIVAEGLADRFDPRLSGVYADIFSYAIARADKQYTLEELRAHCRRLRLGEANRYWRANRAVLIRRMEAKALRRLRTQGAAYRVHGVPRPPEQPEGDEQPGEIVLLSRITLGADIVVTSIIGQALQERFPESHLLLAGSEKSAELLGLLRLPVDYPRSGGLRGRLRAIDALSKIDVDALIVDPDSRFTQLGLCPIASVDRYCFFDTRGAGAGSLVELTRAWCAEVFEVDIARPRIVVGDPPFEYARPAITVSLGVGGNETKRLGPAFERNLLRELSTRAATVIVDKGAGEVEAAIAEAAAEGLPNVRFWSGSFARFAALIANSDLYVGYDSAGQHAAAALNIPLVSIFAGAVNDRFFERWRPDGRVVRIDGGSPESAFVRVRSALPKI